MSIPKDHLEEFALEAIRQTIFDPAMVDKVEAELRVLLHELPNETKQDIDRIRKLQDQNRSKIKNLLTILEDGSTNSLSVRERLIELERDGLSLAQELTVLNERPKKLDIKEVGQIVAGFILNFDQEFENAPIEQRKLLIQKCISHIEIDREKKVARFYLRKIPLVTPALEDFVMSERSARNRT